jgi:hypothetical protein
MNSLSKSFIASIIREASNTSVSCIYIQIFAHPTLCMMLLGHTFPILYLAGIHCTAVLCTLYWCLTSLSRLGKEEMLGLTRLHYLKEKLLEETVNKCLVEIYTDLDSSLTFSGCYPFMWQLLDSISVLW